eukprot:scaffold50314_cov56-Phaeocystis_antarctica.AAC.6
MHVVGAQAGMEAPSRHQADMQAEHPPPGTVGLTSDDGEPVPTAHESPEGAVQPPEEGTPTTAV